MDLGLCPALRRAANQLPPHFRQRAVAPRWPATQRAEPAFRRSDGADGSLEPAVAGRGQSSMKLLVGLVAAGVMLAGMGLGLFGGHSYTVTAYFLSAEGLVPENDVVINGAP